MISLLLGAESSASLLTDLMHALSVAIVAGVVAAYHWRILRADARGEPPPSVPEPQSGSGQVPAETQVTVQIRAATPAALEHAIATLRSTGVEVAVLRA